MLNFFDAGIIFFKSCFFVFQFALFVYLPSIILIFEPCFIYHTYRNSKSLSLSTYPWLDLRGFYSLLKAAFFLSLSLFLQGRLPRLPSGFMLLFSAAPGRQIWESNQASVHWWYFISTLVGSLLSHRCEAATTGARAKNSFLLRAEVMETSVRRRRVCALCIFIYIFFQHDAEAPLGSYLVHSPEDSSGMIDWWQMARLATECTTHARKEPHAKT
jgi:hypothetical protein